MRYRLLNKLGMLTLFTLLSPAPSLAEDTHINLPTLDAPEEVSWHQVDGKMTHQEYGAAVRHNLRKMAKSAEKYVEGQLISLGMSERSVDLTGAVVGLLVEGGGKLRLNESDTLALEVEELVQGDPAMQLSYKFSW